jgi:hypothetical protein
MAADMTDEQFLALVPTLSRVPDEWEDQVFYVIRTNAGECLVLAYDQDEALEAATRYHGVGANAEYRWDADGQPTTRKYPVWGFGQMQYLDATLLLHGDPCVPPMRSPDSSPALSLGAAFLLDAVRIDQRPRTERGVSAAQDMVGAELKRRNDYLQAKGLAAES